MGCAESKSEELKEQERMNKAVEQQLKKAKSEYMSEIKLLLLGCGESGKSTIAKQMKILHDKGFSEQERLAYKPIAFNNCFSAMKALLQAAERFTFEVAPENAEIARFFLEASPVTGVLTPEVAVNLKKLWADAAIQKAFSKRNEFQLIDSATYCFENSDRFAQPEWIPNDVDLLRVRARTTGIIETAFTVKDTNFRMVDVGGQRNERRKWIHCFQEVTAIIYCVALNEYDMKLFEDEKVNRMLESLELFGEIANSKWFVKTSMIIFFNKQDLFKQKIQEIDLSVLWPDYKGGCSYEKALEWITQEFVNANQNPNKKIFPHVTTAVDTENVKVVFDAAKEIIISQNLERLGFGPI